MTEIENTGERILPDKETPFMVARHFLAYKFAEQFIEDKVALDAGSGEGYGAHYLARLAEKVLGIDYHSDVVKFAGEKYKSQNLTFRAMDVNHLAFDKNVFDVVCSFQLIEHIRDCEQYLREVRRVLKNGGLFICSTPNKEEMSPGLGNSAGKYHIREFYLKEFSDLLNRHFDKVDIYAVNIGKKLRLFKRLKKLGILRWIPTRYNPITKFYNSITPDNLVISKNKSKETLDFIGLCCKDSYTVQDVSRTF